MKYITMYIKYNSLLFLLVTSLSTSAAASYNILPLDTIQFSSSHKISREASHCEILHKHIYGSSEKYENIMVKAIAKLLKEGTDKGLRSNKASEYFIGYNFQKTYWEGWYDSMKATSSSQLVKIMKEIYTEKQCNKYTNI